MSFCRKRPDTIKGPWDDILKVNTGECRLVGLTHDESSSTATVESAAYLSDSLHNVIYEIKWDKEVVPYGDHLGQEADTASGWVTDYGLHGETVGDRESTIHAYFETSWAMRSKNGRCFFYVDNMKQRRLTGGSWWFRIRIVDRNECTVFTSNEVEVNWNDPGTTFNSDIQDKGSCSLM